LQKIKLWLPVFLLFIVSCTGEQPTVRPTVDATQRWLNAKCPPEDICAPQSSPEDIGRAFLEAVIAGNCAEAVSYWKPELRTQGMEICSKGIVQPDKSDDRCQLIEFKADHVELEQLAQGKAVLFSGYFLYDCGEEIGRYETNALKLSVDDRDSNWLIIGIDG
jgi:hypothetical protein